MLAPCRRGARSCRGWPQSVQIGLRALLVVVLTVVVQQRFGDDATVTVTNNGATHLPVHLRIPGWATAAIAPAIDGAPPPAGRKSSFLKKRKL